MHFQTIQAVNQLSLSIRELQGIESIWSPKSLAIPHPEPTPHNHPPTHPHPIVKWISRNESAVKIHYKWIMYFGIPFPRI